MIGKVNMEVSHTEMCAAIQFYLNNSVFASDGALRKYHLAKVIRIRQRDSGRFIIDFEGIPETTASDDQSHST